MNWFITVFLSLIEGLTEFLPVSSTGHLIVASSFFGIQDEGFIKSFNIIIQFGAILSVLVIYWKRFLPDLNFYKKILIAFLPAAIIGLLVKNKIDAILDSVLIVGWSLLIGGVIIIWTDQYFEKKQNSKIINDLSWRDCLKLGFIQCFAFVPGVSRSAATILGGLSLGLTKKEAAEFSFFLAVPTLSGAAFIKTLGVIKTIEPSQIIYLLAGVVLSFIFALGAIRFFIGVVSQFGFKYFGYYRIVLGLAVILLTYLK